LTVTATNITRYQTHRQHHQRYELQFPL